MPDWIKRKDVDLNVQSRAFTQGVSSDPAGYGIDPATAAELVDRQAAFAAAMQRVAEPGSNSTKAYAEKDACRASLIGLMRQVAGVIRSRPGITTDQLLAVALRPPEPWRQRAGEPIAQPSVSILHTSGRSATVRVFDLEHLTRAALPRDVIAVAVFVHAGDAFPQHHHGWQSRGLKSHTTFTVEFNEQEIASGEKVWITAAWVGTRKQLGPPAAPAFAYVAGPPMPKMGTLQAA